MINAVAPDTPPIAQQQGISGTVSVMVSLDANSKLVNATVQKSASGLLNNAALQAARASTFATEIVDCKPVAAQYLYVVEFNQQ
jgi:TonB family protein